MRYKVEVTFTEDLLGGAPLDKEVYTNYIAAKKEDMGIDQLEGELATLNEQKGRTGFHRLEDGAPMVYDYAIK